MHRDSFGRETLSVCAAHTHTHTVINKMGVYSESESEEEVRVGQIRFRNKSGSVFGLKKYVNLFGVV